MTQKTITLNAWSKNEQVTPLVVNQNDIMSRTIVINLRDGDNQPLNLTGSTVKVHFVKSDDKIGYISADIIDPLAGQVKCTLTSQITAVDGTVKGTVHIVYTDEQSLHVVGLNIYVNLNDMDSDIESTNDFSALNEGLAKLAGFEQMQTDVATNTANIAELQTDKADKSEVEDLDANKADKAELGIRKKVLWNGSLTSNDTTVTLSDDLSNYAMILVVGRANQWGHYPVGVMMPINTIDGAGWHIGTDLNNKLILSTSAELIFQFPDAKTLKSITGFSEVNQISTVYGLI